MKYADKFTERAELAFSQARRTALALGSKTVGTDHLLLALALESESSAGRFLAEHKLSYETLLGVCKRFSYFEAHETAGSKLSAPLEKVITLAASDAARLRRAFIGTEHLLAAILRVPDCRGRQIIVLAGSNADELFSRLTEEALGKAQPFQPSASKASGKKPELKTLERFGFDMCKAAEAGKYDQVFCREAELNRLIEILCRRTKNNPVLVGEPGVGKTAVCELLAQRLASGSVPARLYGKRLISLDLAAMLAGTRFRGDFEERVKTCLDEVKAAGNIILFIDEIHCLAGAGASEGSIDAASILKPALGRGEIRLIGATTFAEYRKYIEKDGALERRFQRLTVNEPSGEDTMTILRGLRPKFELFHAVSISDDAISAAAELSERYINDRRQPDKAIDLLDEACVSAVLSPSGEACVLRENVARAVSLWTGVPITELSEAEAKQLMTLEARLKKRIIGQDEAVRSAAAAIRRGKSAINGAERPTASILFLGPTGTGKTELARAVAETVFGGKEALVRFDMSEYMEKLSVSSLIGAPPGYAGYGEGGRLTEAVRKKPYCVVLFDEIEKAHPDVTNLLLQILDRGALTDALGREVSFKNCLIILTSNIGGELGSELHRRLGFAASEERDESIRRDAIAQLRRRFSPELLARLDNTIVFHRLGPSELLLIAEKELNGLSKRLAELGISFLPLPCVARHITSALQSDYGAREISRRIKELIEDRLSEMLLSGEVKRGDRITVSVSGGKMEFSAAESCRSASG